MAKTPMLADQSYCTLNDVDPNLNADQLEEIINEALKTAGCNVTYTNHQFGESYMYRVSFVDGNATICRKNGNVIITIFSSNPENNLRDAYKHITEKIPHKTKTMGSYVFREPKEYKKEE